MYLIQTVQTTWRPQLPIPRELQITNEQHNHDVVSHSIDDANVHDDDITKISTDFNDITNPNDDMDRLRKDHNNSSLSGSTQLTNKQKWSFGRLFRKKKEIETESSSEEDRKAGFVPAQKYARGSVGSGGGSGSNAPSNGNLTKPKSKHKSNRGSKSLNSGFDHVVVTSNATQQHSSSVKHQQQHHQHIDNEFFLPVETVTPTGEPYYQNQPQYLPQQQQQQHQLNPQQPQPQYYSRSTNSLDRRALARSAVPAPKSRSAQRLPHGTPGARSSSEEEIISLNSSTFSKYRSDESIHSGGQALQPGQSRRSRAARNERYYKRLSRDGEPSHGGVPASVVYAQPQVQRWKTQPVPLSVYQTPQARPQAMTPQPQQITRLRNTSSLQNVAPYVHWNQMQQQLQQQQQQPPRTKGLQNTVNDAKRSISYDSQIHLQNINGRMHTKPLPPPPPPRDPLRRVHVSHGQLQNGSSGDLRPLSYAFDQCGVPVLAGQTNGTPTVMSSNMGGRCVSDDRIWQPQTPLYQSVHSLNMQSTATPQTPVNTGSANFHRRFITRAERAANPAKKSLPNGIDFHYVADATPRSRKPIHMLETNGMPGQSNESIEPPVSSGILRTTKSGLPASNANEFWQRLDEGQTNATRGRNSSRTTDDTTVKPRSISSSRLCEFRSYPIPMYSEVQKPQRKLPQPTSAYVPNAAHSGADEVDSVVHGSLHIKSKPNTTDNYVEIRHKDVNSKSNSMPQHYQRRSGEMPSTPNKYDEYVAEKREQHAQAPIFTAAPPQQTQQKLNEEVPPIYYPRKKPANLEEAINELEAIYKSLGLTEPPEKPEKLEKRERVPTPSDFDKIALAHADEYDDEDSPTGEPDLVRDDVAYRNLQLANLQHKAAEKQPPFGIPIGPIVPAPQSDYLHVTPDKHKKKSRSPDIVKDDLAVRALRKEPPGPKQHFVYSPDVLQKKHRATRTQSANIYNLIQRDAAKPSGGDLYSYIELSRSLDRAGSMSDIRKDDTPKDIPATLDLLRKLKAQDEQLEQCQTKQEQQQQLHQHHHHQHEHHQHQQPQVVHKKTHIPFRHPSQGGAICQLPERLASSSHAEPHKAPVPLPRKSLTPEPILSNYQMEDALNKIAQDAQESSIKLSKELQELRKEALITASRPKLNAEEQKLEQELQEIEAVSEAAKRCGKMLLDTLPDAEPNATEESFKPARKLHKEGKLIKAIDQVSEAANAVCEKILKDIVTTEPPVIVQEAIKVKQPTTVVPPPPQTSPPRKSPPPAKVEEDTLVTPNLIKKLDPRQSDKIEAIAKRCMRQLSQLAENGDYDNLVQQPSTSASLTDDACNMPTSATGHAAPKAQPNFISTVAEVHQRPRQATHVSKRETLEEIDKIMQECEAQARIRPATAKHSDVSDDQRTTAPSITSNSSGSGSAGTSAGGNVNAPNASTTASSFSSSSDCLAKSSSPTNASQRFSSSITSFNPYSSSDYIKSPSSEYHAPSTDPIKTFSTTSYDVQSSTSATPNITSLSSGSNNLNTANTAKSTFSYTPSPSPPLNLTPVSARRRSMAIERARSSSPSQYNSSEELAMIFGIEEKPKQQRCKSQQSGNANANANVGHNPVSIIKNTMPDPSIANTKPVTAEAAHIASASAIDPVMPAMFATNNAFIKLNITENADRDTDHDHKDNIDEANPVHVVDVPNNAASSASNCSMSSFKLSTIPELNNEHDHERSQSGERQMEHTSAHTQIDNDAKLSPNFNRIFASKINITVDREISHAQAPITQFDSLSSLEDVSSNPDSGNVSLADFPLISQTNTTLELQTAYNSRFEVKESYISEVSISEEVSTESAMVEDSDFPRLPTEEELLDSLRESEIGTETENDISIEQLNESEQDFDEVLEERYKEANRLSEETPKTDASVELNESEKDFNELLKKEIINESLEKLNENGEVHEEHNKEAIRLSKETQKIDASFEKLNESEKDFDELLRLQKIDENFEKLNESEHIFDILLETEKIDEKNFEKINDCVKDFDALLETQQIDESFEQLNESVAFNETTDEAEFEWEADLLKILDSADSVDNANDSAYHEFNESELNETPIVLLPLRRKSIVFETPPLCLNISEVKLNYESDTSPTEETIDANTRARNEVKVDNNETTEVEQFPILRQRKKTGNTNVMPITPDAVDDGNDDDDADDEQPCSSSKALSIFGEVRRSPSSMNQEEGAAAMVAETHSLTTLEHVFVACTVGLITTNDLLTLLLIIIGVIIIIAVALF